MIGMMGAMDLSSCVWHGTVAGRKFVLHWDCMVSGLIFVVAMIKKQAPAGLMGRR